MRPGFGRGRTCWVLAVWLLACAPHDAAAGAGAAPRVHIARVQPNQLREVSASTRADAVMKVKPAPNTQLLWHHDGAAARRLARVEGRLLVTYVHAQWAVPAVRMQRDSWSDPLLKRALAGAVLLWLDVTAADGIEQATINGLGAVPVPLVIVRGATGSVRAEGELSRAELRDFLLDARRRLQPTK